MTSDSNFNEGMILVTSSGVRYIMGNAVEAPYVTSVATNAWIHYVATNYKNAAAGTYTPKLYINGTLVSTGTGSTAGQATSVGPDSPFTIGYNWNGKISCVRMYSRDLSLGEIQQNYNATKSRFGL
jgi:hypothetical protein